VAGKRDAFIAELARYARIRGHAVTVVFDGFPPDVAIGAGTASGRSRYPAGVRVRFSEHERADDVVIRLAATLREQATIVSSDREVRAACESHRSVVLGSQAFDTRLRDALMNAGGLDADPEVVDKDRDLDEDVRRGNVKRGNPRRASKAQRTSQKRLGKL
jgi:hypothetical protein